MTESAERLAPLNSPPRARGPDLEAHSDGSRVPRILERLSCDYFDVRFYRRAGTFHLFPRRKDLIERMNRTVGRARQWLPHDRSQAPEGFWRQYEEAEKEASRMRDLQALVSQADCAWSETRRDEARQRLEQSHLNALAELGITYSHELLIEHEQALLARRSPTPHLPLLSASTAA